MLNFIFLHCPACSGALNVPTGMTSTLFKRWEVFINYNYAYGFNQNGRLNASTFNAFISRNFLKFSVFAMLPWTHSLSQTMEGTDNINSLYGLDIGLRYFPIYSKFSKFKTTLSLLVSYKVPVGFYRLNGINEDIVDYLSFGGGYAFVYARVLAFGEAIYSKALKDNHIQSDKSRIVIGSYYVFGRFEIGPIFNYVYQSALNSNEFTAGLSLGVNSVLGLVGLNLNLHKSIFYEGDGVSNNYSFELIARFAF